jgi:hypothetical protein
MHRYQRPGSEGMPVPLNATALSEGTNEDRAEDEDADTPMFQKYSPLLHGGAAAEVEDGAAPSGASGAGAGEQQTDDTHCYAAAGQAGDRWSSRQLRATYDFTLRRCSNTLRSPSNPPSCNITTPRKPLIPS